MPPQPTTKPASSRVFRVIRGNVGAWKQGDVFTETAFIDNHPPVKDSNDANYHNALINRLISVKAIAVAPDNPEPTPLPAGMVDNRDEKPLPSSGIDAAARAVTQQRQAMQDSMSNPAQTTPAQQEAPRPVVQHGMAPAPIATQQTSPTQPVEQKK